MKLTQKQQLLIERYIKAVANELGDVPETARQQAAEQLRTAVWKQARELKSDPCQDAEIMAILHQFGSPAQQAERFIEERGVSPAMALATTDPVWLGVCGGIAAYEGARPWQVRAAAVLLGLVTGPLAIMSYIVIYFVMYFNAQRQSAAFEVPAFHVWPVIKSAGVAIAAIVPIHIVARICLHFLPRIYSLLVPQKGFPELGAWNWLEPNLSLMLFLVLLVSVPWAVLGGLPMARQWDATARRLAYATIAIYAVAVCLGLASSIVGLILAGIGILGYTLR